MSYYILYLQICLVYMYLPVLLGTFLFYKYIAILHLVELTQISMFYSCFIARNLLPGLRTCKEVFNYMYGDGAGMSRGSLAMLNAYFEDVRRDDMDHMVRSLLLLCLTNKWNYLNCLIKFLNT